MINFLRSLAIIVLISLCGKSLLEFISNNEGLKYKIICDPSYGDYLVKKKWNKNKNMELTMSKPSCLLGNKRVRQTEQGF